MTGNELKRIRSKEFETTQLLLAIDLGVDPSTVAKWEQLKDQEIPGSRMLELALMGLKVERAGKGSTRLKRKKQP